MNNKKILFIPGLEEPGIKRASTLASILLKHNYTCDIALYRQNNAIDLRHFSQIYDIIHNVNNLLMYSKKPIKIIYIIIRKITLIITLLLQYEKNNKEIRRRLASIYNIKTFAQIIDFSQYNLVIFNEINIEYASEIILKKLKELNINAILAPVFIVDSLEPFNFYINNQQFHPTSEQEHNLRNSNWLYTYNQKTLMRLPYKIIQYYEKYNITPPLPWVSESNNSRIPILTESKNLEHHYLAQGFKKDELLFVGSESFTEIAEYRNNKDIQLIKLKLDPDKKTVVIAPPMWHNKITQTKFQTLDNLREFIYQKVYEYSNNKWNIMISPHPRDNIDAVKKMANKFNFTVFTEGTNKTIGMSDLFIATISGTIRYALACGIPVINYDVYNLDYTDFKQSATKTVFTEQNFLNELESHLCNEECYQSERKKYTLDMKNWGLMDDKFEERFLSIVQKYEK